MQKIVQAFGFVDSNYLDKAIAIMRTVKQRSYELMRVGEGQTVLDLGCGVGIDTLNLADLVGPSGRVFGLDHDPDMILEAERRAGLAGLEGRVKHQLGDAAILPFPDGNFDACRTERMLIHLEDPFRAVSELHRVLKPDGWLVLAEADWGSMSITSGMVDIERRLARVRAEQFLRNGYAGRLLNQWMVQAGFEDIVIEITPLYWNRVEHMIYQTALDQVEDLALARGLVSQQELEDWRTELKCTEKRGCFYGCLNIVTAAGRKSLLP